MLLKQIHHELSSSSTKHTVHIPSLWVEDTSESPVIRDYKKFICDSISEIERYGNRLKKSKAEDWSKNATVYNIFVRFFSAYDHNQDGIIGQESDNITLNKQGLRETGTFLKTLALLPYLYKLGINTIHLLPITKIGLEGRKGDLGSPYAIKNPFEIDPNLADPIVEIPIENQYKALVEGAHKLGMKVVQEFIFRTASIDSDWTREYPDWFYWIKKGSNYSAPKFNRNDLSQILKVPRGKGKFVPPDKKYRDLFRIPDKSKPPENSKVASAFADWPPDDLQPPWTDVTYLRLYNYNYKKLNNFNYIAYNTIRYYDPELAQHKNINHKLWDKISGIIPYYQKMFGIDGAMIDMGHALPPGLKSEIIEKARNLDACFAFWDENFDNKDETKKEGYNAVIGNTWHKITKRNGFRNIILTAPDKKPLPRFGTPETHNTPRFSFNNTRKKKASWLLFNLLPKTIPFIHNGFELNENLPVNTGLNFTKNQITYLSRQPLPLFYKSSMNWDTKSDIVTFILKIANIKKKFPWIFNHTNQTVLETDNRKVLGFIIHHQQKTAIALFNTNFYQKEQFMLENSLNHRYSELITGKTIEIRKNYNLGKGNFILAKSVKSKR